MVLFKNNFEFKVKLRLTYPIGFKLVLRVGFVKQPTNNKAKALISNIIH